MQDDLRDITIELAGLVNLSDKWAKDPSEYVGCESNRISMLAEDLQRVLKMAIKASGYTPKLLTVRL